MSDIITLKSLCEELKINPREAREKLRTAVGDPNITASASGMVVVKNSLFLGMLLASLQDLKMMYPQFLLLDNVEDKGMVGDRVRNL